MEIYNGTPCQYHKTNGGATLGAPLQTHYKKGGKKVNTGNPDKRQLISQGFGDVGVSNRSPPLFWGIMY